MAKLAQIKTKETESSVEEFINSVPDEQKRKDSFALVKLMQKATKAPPTMWGTSIIGFGNMRYVSPKTGREVDFLKIGFSPRKANFSVYLVGGLKSVEPLLKKLGKHKVGGGCLYINKLADVDTKVLEEILKIALKVK